MKIIEYMNPEKDCNLKITLDNGEEVIFSEYEVNKIAMFLERFNARQNIEEEIANRIKNGTLSKDDLIVKDKGSITPLIDFYLENLEMDMQIEKSEAIYAAFDDFEKDIKNQHNLNEYLCESYDNERIEELKELEKEEIDL